MYSWVGPAPFTRPRPLTWYSFFIQSSCIYSRGGWGYVLCGWVLGGTCKLWEEIWLESCLNLILGRWSLEQKKRKKKKKLLLQTVYLTMESTAQYEQPNLLICNFMFLGDVWPVGTFKTVWLFRFRRVNACKILQTRPKFSWHNSPGITSLGPSSNHFTTSHPNPSILYICIVNTDKHKSEEWW